MRIEYYFDFSTPVLMFYMEYQNIFVLHDKVEF